MRCVLLKRPFRKPEELGKCHVQAWASFLDLTQYPFSVAYALGAARILSQLPSAAFWVWQGGLSTLPRGNEVNGLDSQNRTFLTNNHKASHWLSTLLCGVLGDESLETQTLEW